MGSPEVFSNRDDEEDIRVELEALHSLIDRSTEQLFDLHKHPDFLDDRLASTAGAEAFYGVSTVGRRGVSIAGAEYIEEDGGWRGRIHATSVVLLSGKRRAMVESGIYVIHEAYPDGTVERFSSQYLSIAETFPSKEVVLAEWRIHADPSSGSASIYFIPDLHTIIRIEAFSRESGMQTLAPYAIPFQERAIERFITRGVYDVSKYVLQGAPEYVADISTIYADLATL